MSLLNKVIQLFADANITETVFTYVKTEDGKIFLVKAKELIVDADIVEVAEDATENPVTDGDYILEDKSTITVKDGKVSVITPELETKEEDVAEGGVEETIMSTIIKQISKWSTEIDQDSIVVGTKLTSTDIDGNIYTISSGEYDMEDGSKLQVDADGIVVLITKDGEVDKPIIEAVDPIELSSLRERVKELESSLMSKEEEVKMSKVKLEELNKKPAVDPIDTRKFSKTKTNSFGWEVGNMSKEPTMLEKVLRITEK